VPEVPPPEAPPPANTPHSAAAPPPSHPRPPLRDALRGIPATALTAVAIGGALGALARYGLTAAFPTEPGTFALATFLANISGGLLIGALMIIVTDVAPGLRLIRPFLGVGVLGGFTTFSTYIIDIGRAANAGATLLAVTYAFTTIAAALLAAAIGMYATRRIVRARRGNETA
jgi:CrcB protein